MEMRRAELPPAWARDPFGRFPHRLFDGQAWTDRVARGGRTSRDAFLMGSPSPPPELPTACDQCGFDVGDAKFCPRCGTPAAPPARPPYCYQCASNPMPGAAFCHECGSRLDALAPGLSMRDAKEWQRRFHAIGWLKDLPDPEHAYRDSVKKSSRLGWNLHSLLRDWDLPAFDGEDPSEPWMLWLPLGSRRRGAWLTADGADVSGDGGAEASRVDTLIVTRCRLIAIAPGGLAGRRPKLAFTESLANVTDATVGSGSARLRFGTAAREVRLRFRTSNRPSPLAPADLRGLTPANPGPPTPNAAPLRRATDRRDGGRFIAEALLGAFARQVAAVSSTND
jgi:hypothetical protein